MPSKEDFSQKSCHINKLLDVGGLRWYAQSFLDNHTLAMLGTTNRENNLFFKPELKRKAAKQLLKYVILGDEINTKKMLKVNASLLLIQSELNLQSGRKIRASAFQAALGVGDSRMCQMMKHYFEYLEKVGKINSALTEMVIQFNEQFRDGFDTESADELKPRYQRLVADIIAGRGDEAILQFRQAFLATLKESTSGHYFNMQHLIVAMTVYSDNFARLEHWHDRNTYWIKVIGYIQRHMPMHYTQAHCSGLIPVLSNPKFFQRSLNFRGEESFLPFEDNKGLGFDFAIFSLGNGWLFRDVISGALGVLVMVSMQKLTLYTEQQQRCIIELISANSLNPLSPS